MTEPLTEDEGPEAPSLYGRRLFLTTVLVALYLAGHLVNLPMVHLDRIPFVTPVSTSLLALGVMPLMVGFTLVEIFSLVTPPGRRLRASGFEGRARLNRAALVASLLISAMQALGIALFLEGVSSGFEPVVEQPGRLFRLLLMLTLVAVTAMVFHLGTLLSEYGVGNGFALLILAGTGWSVWQEGVAVRSKLTEDNPLAALGIFVTVGLVALLVRYVRSTEATWTPPFPQGILPVQWGVAILSFPWLVELLGYQVGNFNVGFLMSLLIVIPLLSWLTFSLFSSRPRVEANLPDTMEGIYRVEDNLERRLKPSAALLTLGTVALFTWNAWQPHSMLTTYFVFPDLVIGSMIGLDLLDQYRFLRRHGQTARLVQLDNVHLSYRLVERLREKGIDVLARAQRMRSLLFFFGALIKIDVLVPREQEERAREVWAEVEAAPQIIV